MTMNKRVRFEDLILYHDESYVIINKPAGLSTLDDRSESKNVLTLAREEFPTASPCHRLDKDTSGVLIIALHTEAYKYLATRLEHREVKKIYHAVALGLHSFQNEEADQPLYAGSSKTRVDYAGKESLTLLQTLETFKKHTLVKCFPVTGRMHQIRVHLSNLGAPIVEDKLYGGRSAYLSELKRNFKLSKFEEENPMIRRLALHAAAITFLHPDSGETIEIEAPYPKDFEVFIKQLRKFG